MNKRIVSVDGCTLVYINIPCSLNWPNFHLLMSHPSKLLCLKMNGNPVVAVKILQGIKVLYYFPC